MSKKSENSVMKAGFLKLQKKTSQR